MLVDAKVPVGGISIPELSAPTADQNRNYAMSKVGNWFLASEFVARVRGDGVVSVTLNPGNLGTKIWDAAPRVARILTTLVLHEPKMGACTALWAGGWVPRSRWRMGGGMSCPGEGGILSRGGILRWP